MHELLGANKLGHEQRQAFPAIFFNNNQHAECCAVSGATLDKNDGPGIVSPFLPQADQEPSIQVNQF